MCLLANGHAGCGVSDRAMKGSQPQNIRAFVTLATKIFFMSVYELLSRVLLTKRKQLFTKLKNIKISEKKKFIIYPIDISYIVFLIFGFYFFLVTLTR